MNNMRELNYEDIYLVIMEDSRRTQLVRPKIVYDGGMVEFYDAVTEVYIGCCGINWWHNNAVLFDQLKNQDLPPWPTIHS